MNGILTITFGAGNTGAWDIERIMPVIGDTLDAAPRLSVAQGESGADLLREPSKWLLRGVVSNQRYSSADELRALKQVSPGLMRDEAVHGALIPIKKNAEWWAMAQDERRAIFEEKSGHISHSMKYLPAVARRLHHSRDLGEPFDFLTWFEYAPEHESAFEDLLVTLRASEEWRYVEREVDIRLVRSR